MKLSEILFVYVYNCANIMHNLLADIVENFRLKLSILSKIYFVFFVVVQMTNSSWADFPNKIVSDTIKLCEKNLNVSRKSFKSYRYVSKMSRTNARLIAYIF